MKDYKTIKVSEPLTASELIAGLCFGAVFYGLIFIILSI